MNTLTKSLFAASCLVSFVCLPLGSPAASDQPAAPKGRPLAKMYPYGERARDLLGISVRDSAGESLGKLNNLVIDPPSGRIVYAIVSTGGVLGLGDTLHAVPFSAVSYASDAREQLQVDTTLADWQHAPVYNPDNLVSLADQEKADSLFNHYHQTWEPLANDPDRSAASTTPRLLTATSLLGRDVRVGEKSIGVAEDLIVSVASRRVQLLLRPEHSFAGSTHHFVVPFSKVTASTTNSDTLATTLTSDDFKSVGAFDHQAWEDRSGNSIYRWKLADPASAHASNE